MVRAPGGMDDAAQAASISMLNFAMIGATRPTVHLLIRRWWVGALVVAALVAVLAELRAQLAPGDDAQVLVADKSLGDALRNGNSAVARKLLSLQFAFVDETGRRHARKDFLADLKGAAAAPASKVSVKIYGLVAMVTGHRRSARGNDVFFLDIWAKQKRSWRALVLQDVVVAAAEPSDPAPGVSADDSGLVPCTNPCQTIPYRVRSPAEQDIVNAFQAIEKAIVARDADGWAAHTADEFVRYRSGHIPLSKSDRMAIIADEKEHNIPPLLTAIQSMRLWVYGDGAAMISTNGATDNTEPILRVASVWVKRNGQWQMAISAQTMVASP